MAAAARRASPAAGGKGASVPKRVYAWGAGEDGQLGLGTRDDEHRLKPITALDGLDISSVVAGSRNSLAICANGDVYVWGWNQRGTLGHPPNTASTVESTPSQVKDLAGVRIVQAAIGGWHCLAVDDEGNAYAWGGNEYGQCAVKSERNWSGKISRRDIPIPQPCAPHLRVRQVAAGGTHSVVLTEDGEVWSWGQPWPPGDIQQIWNPVKVQALEKVKVIAVGAFHNLALLENGQVWAWGNNEYGQLGTGDTQPRASPEEIKELSEINVVDISAGGWHSMALTATGEVWAWGRGEHGRMGFGDDKSSKTTPHRVELLSDVVIVQVTCGGTHSIALSEDGRIFSFGRGDHGRLGNGLLITDGHPREVPLPSPLSRQPTEGSISEELSHSSWQIVFTACGGRHTLVLASTRHPMSSCTALLPWYRQGGLRLDRVNMVQNGGNGSRNGKWAEVSGRADSMTEERVIGEEERGEGGKEGLLREEKAAATPLTSSENRVMGIPERLSPVKIERMKSLSEWGKSNA